MATLYLMVGYPGSGKTTTSRIIHSLTGAEHLWADYERRAMFAHPTHSTHESRQLYDHLNQRTDQLLSQGTSVIFDTNFGLRRDRDLLRDIARNHGADVHIVWVRVDPQVARARAVHQDHASHNQYPDTMSEADFDRMAGHLQPPADDEQPLVLDGTKISAEYVANQLGLPVAA